MAERETAGSRQDAAMPAAQLDAGKIGAKIFTGMI